MADDRRQLKWKDLDGQERYRVVELIRKGEVKIQDLCQTFGVSRQTLHRAVAAADQAAVEALASKPRGRKPEPAIGKQVKDLARQNRRLEKDLHQMSQRYEIAKALLELQRKAERGEALPGEKKTPHPTGRPSQTGPGRTSRAQGMDGHDGGRGSGSDQASSEGVDPAPGNRRRDR